jgi:hypothetical protein
MRALIYENDTLDTQSSTFVMRKWRLDMFGFGNGIFVHTFVLIHLS